MSQDPHLSGLVEEVLANFSGVAKHTMPSFEDLFLSGSAGRDGDKFEIPQYNMDDPALILHSSGTYFSLIARKTRADEDA